MDYCGDLPFFKDGFYIYSTGQQVSESDMIEGAQSLDEIDNDEKRETFSRT